MSAENNKKVARDDLLDPDVRFLLANERTLLAWIRTGLAVLAGGVALTQVGPSSQTQDFIGMAAILLGGVMAIVGYIRFQAADKAIRRGELPTIGHEPAIQAISVAAIAVALVATHILNIW